MPRFAFVNNKYIEFKKAQIHIEDRGFQFADSVYEVIVILKKNFIDLNFHLKRLRYSLNELDIKFKFNDKLLKKIFMNLIKKNQTTNGIIYLQVTRGIQYREHKYNKNLSPTLIIYTRNKKFNLPGKNFVGVNTITFEDLRWKRRDIKSVSLLGNVLAKKEALKKNVYEAILVENNKVTEATASNVWIVKNKRIITHPSNTDILKGITREAIKKLIKKNKLILKERSFSIKELYNADEVFITSSGSFVTPIIKIDSKLINKGKIGNISLQLALLYSNLFINN